MSNVKLTMFVFSLADHVRQADNVFGRRRPLLAGSLLFASNRSIAEIDNAMRPAVRPPERSDHLTK